MKTRLSQDKIQLFTFFIGLSLIGSFILTLPFAYRHGETVPWIDALFTAMSAVCVTGLSTLSMDVYTPAGFLVIMLLIELGGLGIISFVSIYLFAPRSKVSLVNRSVIREFFTDDVEINPKRILLAIGIFTIGIELVFAAILYLPFRNAGSTHPAFEAVFHSVSAFCNAGFSTRSNSLESFAGNPLILSSIMALIILGGLGFSVLTDIYKVISRQRRRLSYHSRIVLVVSSSLIIISALLFFALEFDVSLAEMSLGEKVWNALFQAVTPRTAGFNTVNQADLSPASQLITMILMFIGGSPASIAGGVKTTTFVVVVLYALRGNTEHRGMHMGGRRLNSATIEKAFSIVSKSIMIILVASFALLISERLSLQAGIFSVQALFFEVFSAFATVGLSQGITGALSDPGKAVLIATMFIGRTGIFAMAIGFAQHEQERLYAHPSASIMIG